MILPALLLLVVAAIGVVRGITLDQSSWRGASFGMFATYGGSSRDIEVTLIDHDGCRRRALLPEDLASAAKRLEVVPTDTAAVRLAASTRDRLPAGAVAAVEVVVLRSHLELGEQVTLRRAVLARGVAR